VSAAKDFVAVNSTSPIRAFDALNTKREDLIPGLLIVIIGWLVADVITKSDTLFNA